MNWDELTDPKQVTKFLIDLGFKVQGVKQDGGNWWRTYKRTEPGVVSVQVEFDVKDAQWYAIIMVTPLAELLEAPQFSESEEHLLRASMIVLLEPGLEVFKSVLSEALIVADKISEAPKSLVDRSLVMGYLQTALWSSTDDEGHPLDREFTVRGFTDDARRQAKVDLNRFFQRVQDQVGLHPVDWAQAAHDFWLTRNGHGSGFWYKPREYGGQKNADRLTKIAKEFPEVHVFVTDSGELEFT